MDTSTLMCYNENTAREARPEGKGAKDVPQGREQLCRSPAPGMEQRKGRPGQRPIASRKPSSPPGMMGGYDHEVGEENQLARL